jgi:precorrin-6Y C5,15-methyltransferase (decarboxylating)
MADNEIVAIFFNMADRDCQSKWLSIIGIGEDGLEGLSSGGAKSAFFSISYCRW